MKIAPCSRLLMVGDSITDCDRARPRGEGFANQLGTGYVAFVDALLRTSYPNHRVQITNMGVGGNTVRDLAVRWDTDVIALQPNWLSVMIGINDIGRQFSPNPVRVADGVFPEEFERTYDELLGRTRPHLQGLVLMAPFLIESGTDDPMLLRVVDYGRIVKRLATRYDAAFVDTQIAFNRLSAGSTTEAFGLDRVHPNRVGHMVLARAFLDALDFSWN